jgi:hypothetical protein
MEIPLLLFIAAVFWTCSIVDVLKTVQIDSQIDRPRTLSAAWIVVVMTVPVAGGIAWLRWGRSMHAEPGCLHS